MTTKVICSDKCESCGRFPGDGEMCKDDALRRIKIYFDSSKCLNSI
jgi:hypothetical protein